MSRVENDANYFFSDLAEWKTSLAERFGSLRAENETLNNLNCSHIAVYVSNHHIFQNVFFLLVKLLFFCLAPAMSVVYYMYFAVNHGCVFSNDAVLYVLLPMSFSASYPPLCSHPSKITFIVKLHYHWYLGLIAIYSSSPS